jgi:hypothetical protein
MAEPDEVDDGPKKPTFSAKQCRLLVEAWDAMLAGAQPSDAWLALVAFLRWKAGTSKVVEKAKAVELVPFYPGMPGEFSDLPAPPPADTIIGSNGVEVLL